VKLIVTRPEPAATRTASKLRDLGHEVFVSPVLEIVDTSEEMPKGDFSFVIITSANALTVLGQCKFDKSLLETPLYAVGDHTAEMARAMGFVDVHSASGNAEDLVALIKANKTKAHTGNNSALYISGADSTRGFTDSLLDAGLSIVQWVSYKANLVNQLTKKSAELLRSGEAVGVLLYSPRSARQFSKVYDKVHNTQDADNIILFAISNAIKHSLPSSMQSRCSVATLPNESSLFDLLKD